MSSPCLNIGGHVPLIPPQSPPLLHMAINDVAGERVYHVGDLPEFLGHNFVSGLYTLKP